MIMASLSPLFTHCICQVTRMDVSRNIKRKTHRPHHFYTKYVKREQKEAESLYTRERERESEKTIDYKQEYYGWVNKADGLRKRGAVESNSFL